MPGPVAKHPEVRRRANKPAAGEWVDLPASGRSGPVPPIPKGTGLGKEAMEWWATVWKSPSATMWSEQDIPALLELAVLRERLMDGKISVAPEVRLRSEEFGLTPKGRQDRRWRIVEMVGDEKTVLPDELEEKRAVRRERVAAN